MEDSISMFVNATNDPPSVFLNSNLMASYIFKQQL